MPIPVGSAQSIEDLLRHAAQRDPHAVAVMGGSGMRVSYKSLLSTLNEVRAVLNRAGIGRGDRVALVVPDGPELAIASIAVAASAVCIPLNPASRANEFDFYLSDSRAKALIVQAGIDSPAIAVARQKEIAILGLHPGSTAQAGILRLSSGKHHRSTGGVAQPSDTALVLYTSGTTASPKRVPLTHENVCTSARNIAAALKLDDRDRCLNVMPLHHVHGLIGATLSTLAAGASIVCPPKFDETVFFAWLEEFQPSWYTAVPTIHQAILSCAGQFTEIIHRSPLRFIRSCSAPLPRQVMEGLERVFSVPVIEAYGMTEASHQISSNPLPPHRRRSGSVGPATGCEVAVMGGAGELLPPGGTGEIVIRGPAIVRGYEDDPEANAAAFRAGWFRTGDLGTLDIDGYLFLKGRIKDLINRGGEKVSPREVEDRLAEHQAAVETVVFPLPHPTLGEDVAAAVVLRPGMTASERDLRQFVALSLADFKVPCRVLVVDDIPKSPTGKVRRQALAAHFDRLLTTPFVAPENLLQETLARIWAEVLEIEDVGIHDNFFELGGDSLRAARMCTRVQAETGRSPSVETVHMLPTVAQLARFLRRIGATNGSPSAIVPIQAEGSRPPLFCMHSRWGCVSDYIPLAQRLGTDQPVYGLEARGIDGSQSPHARVEDVAAQYVQEIRAFFPRGPYLLCGRTLTAILAWEVAQQLLAQGEQVALLALLDPELYLNPALAPERVSALQVFRRRALLHMDALRELSPRDRLAYMPRRLKMRWKRRASAGLVPTAPGPEFDPAEPAAVQAQTEAARAYVPRTYPGPVTLILVRQPAVNLRYDSRLPGKLATGPVETHEVSGDHDTFLKEPRVRALAKTLRDCIDRAIEPGRDPDAHLPFPSR